MHTKFPRASYGEVILDNIREMKTLRTIQFFTVCIVVLTTCFSIATSKEPTRAMCIFFACIAVVFLRHLHVVYRRYERQNKRFARYIVNADKQRYGR